MKTLIIPSLIASLMFPLAVPVMNAQDTLVDGPHDCTIHLNDRSKLSVTRFWKIDAHAVEYEHEGSLHDVPLASVERVRCANGDYKIIDLQLLSTDSLARMKAAAFAGPSSPTELYRMGRQDGAQYYGGGGAFAGGFFAAPTLIGPLIIMAVPPPLDSPRNPNRALLDDPDYRKGYKKAAHGKKAGHVLVGMITGLAALFVAAEAAW